MFINFIGVNGLVLNLNAIALIEDISDDDTPKIQITTITGDALDFDGEDAIAILERCEFLLQITDNLTAQAQQAAANIANSVPPKTI